MAVILQQRLGCLFTGVVVLSTGFRFLYLHEVDVLHLHTFNVIGDMALGGLPSYAFATNV